MQLSIEAGRGRWVGPPGAGVAGCWELPTACWELHLDLLEGQQVLLTAGPLAPAPQTSSCGTEEKNGGNEGVLERE